MTCGILACKVAGVYSFFYPLNNHMAGADQCYMRLMYLGDTDIVSTQMSKVHSHYGSSACCQLLSIKLFHDRATLFLVS